MRGVTATKTTTIEIRTELTLYETGRIEVSTVTTSHGGATAISLGKLNTDGPKSWWVTERGSDGVERGTLFAESKKAALTEFARRATAKAATWAVAP